MKAQFKKLSIFILALFGKALVFAQDGGGDGLDIDVSIGEESQVWYQNPLYWVIGALLLIILVAMLTRGNNNK